MVEMRQKVSQATTKCTLPLAPSPPPTDQQRIPLSSQVMDLSKYCERRMAVLVDHVEEGYENNWWEYNGEMADAMVGAS